MGEPNWYERGIRSGDEQKIWIAHATRMLLAHEHQIGRLTLFAIAQCVVIACLVLAVL